jgi:hypothetical protein
MSPGPTWRLTPSTLIVTGVFANPAWSLALYNWTMSFPPAVDEAIYETRDWHNSGVATGLG